MCIIRAYLLIQIIISILLFNNTGYGQGCSDAGICSACALNGIQNPARDTVQKANPNSIILFEFFGLGEQSTKIYTTQLQWDYVIIKDQLSSQIKLPYSFIDGKLGNVNGLNDITINLSYRASNKNRVNWMLIGGIKIPTGKANNSINNLPLPMIYQTSLGSYDVLAGLKMVYRKWDLSIGYQHSFSSTENHYLHLPIADSIPYNNYYQSNKMKRADDALVRINRNIKIKTTNLMAGVLFIYHLKDDDIINKSGQMVKATGSKGVTLNFNVGAAIPLSEHSNFLFSFGAPLITRKYKTDGLARAMVISVAIERMF